MLHSVVTALPIHKYRYVAENATAVHQVLDALSAGRGDEHEGTDGGVLETIADLVSGLARLAGGVKMMLEALEQHLMDFNFKEVRDGVVKLRQLGRGHDRFRRPRLRECARRVCGAQQLACLALRDCRCCQTSPVKISVMPAESNSQRI